MKLVSISIVVSFFIFNFVSAYDQDNTHPALTDEIVDFYNLSYPSEPIPEEFKQVMIRGAVEEDEDVRPLNHFYDPVYNKGFANYQSSKEWAINSEGQEFNLNKYAAIFEVSPSSLENTSYGNYSYERAIKDYAMGDKKRAFRALGHTLHLLEDANVPDHTRDDPHPPMNSEFGSPYEKEMAKWGPVNTSIAKPLFDQRTRPIIFNNIERYFDEVAFYSNNYFFSEDTIFIQRYKKPDRYFGKEENGEKYIFSFDKDNSTFKLAVVGRKHTRNFNETKTITLNDDAVLNDYWPRLSKQLIPYGTGLVRLFLAQAQEAEKLYQERKVEEPKLGFFDKLLSAVNPFGGEEQEAKKQNDQIAAEIASDILSGEIPTNIKPEPSPQLLPKSENKVSQEIVLSGPTPTAPAQTPKISPSPGPTPTLSPSPSPTPTLTASPTPIPTIKLSTAKKSGRVIINEIGWMGTLAAATDEWIELYNIETEAIDISDWTLKSDDNSPNIVFKEGTIIPANSYFFIERTADDTISNITADLFGSFGQGGLNDAGEVLTLADGNGVIVDKVGSAGEKWYAGDPKTKVSMERIDPSRSGNDSSNWKSFTGQSSTALDAKGNQVLGTPKMLNSSVASVVISGGGGGGGGSSSSTPTPSPSVSPTPSPSPTPEPESDSSLRTVVINEIAWMGTATQSSDEWMELYNTTNQTVDLTGWTLKSLTGTSPDPQITLIGSVGPFGFYLLERTDNTTISDILADKTYTGALNNSGEYLELRDSGGNLQDFVNGTSAWFSKGIASPDYKTMERINPRQSGNDVTNWATNNGTIRNGLDADNNPINGTPKAQNSISSP